MNMMRRCRPVRWATLGGLLLFLASVFPAEGQAQWVRIPLPPTVAYVPGLTAGSEYLFASMRDSSGTPLGLFRTPLENPGEWESLGLDGYLLRSIVVAGPGDSHILVPGPVDTQIFGSTDGGQTWSPRHEGIDDDGRGVICLGWNGAFPGRVYASVRRDSGGFWIYHSTDFGSGWTKWTDNEIGVAEFRYLAVPQDGGSLAYAMLFGGFQTYHRYKTTDGGVDWAYLPPYYEGGYIDLELSTDHRDLFAASPFAGILCWRDDANEFVIWPPLAECGQIGTETAVWAPGILFVAGVDADSLLTVVLTEYPYTEWTVVQDGFPDSEMNPCDAWDNGPMFQFEAAPHAPNLFVSTPGHGLWMRDMSDVVGLEQRDRPDQSRLSLLPPLPNPTSSGVSFRAPGAQGLPITLQIIDVQGRTINRWTTTPTGSEGSFSWDGRTFDGQVVPPGLYYLKVQSAGGSAATTFTVIR